MLTVLYIEGLLADEVLAGDVWALCDSGVMPDDLAALAWYLIALQMADPKFLALVERACQ